MRVQRPTPFDVSPVALFWKRMVPVFAAAVLVLCIVLGEVARSPQFKDGLLIRDFESKSAPQVAFLMIQGALGALFSPPALCFSGGAESEFTQKQCEEFWARLKTHLVVLAIPLGILAALAALLWSLFQGAYRNARESIALRKDMLGTGEVSRVGAARFDVFEWFFCLTPVELKIQGKTLTSYLPASEYLPRKGDQRVVYRWKKFGAARFITEPHAPHTAVMSGTLERR
jgi:hypothetical protein